MTPNRSGAPPLAAVTAAAILSVGTGWTTGISAVLAAACVLVWNMAIYFDSSALTADTAQAADQHLRGATMGLHSMAGYAGGFLGPLGVGLVLDLCGGDNLTGWGLAFGHLAFVTLIGSSASSFCGNSAAQQADGVFPM
jgi:MFS family permease